MLRPSGHFRHMQADLWDPHPQYSFSAFGIPFLLQLAHDASFVDPNILVSECGTVSTPSPVLSPYSADCESKHM